MNLKSKIIIVLPGPLSDLDRETALVGLSSFFERLSLWSFESEAVASRVMVTAIVIAYKIRKTNKHN